MSDRGAAHMAVLGVGIDVVDVARFEAALARQPSMAERMFTGAERTGGGGRPLAPPRLAARFAAKEAAMKALGVGLGAFALHDVEVVGAATGQPALAVRGRAAELASALGVTDWKLSLSHDGPVATAVVVAQ